MSPVLSAELRSSVHAVGDAVGIEVVGVDVGDVGAAVGLVGASVGDDVGDVGADVGHVHDGGCTSTEQHCAAHFVYMTAALT